MVFVFQEKADVGVAAQEPEELAFDQPKGHLLGRQDRETFLQVKAHLVAEDRLSSGSGPVPLLVTEFQDVARQV